MELTKELQFFFEEYQAGQPIAVDSGFFTQD